MPLAEFELHEPETVEEAIHLLTRYGDEARPIAGGTTLVLMMHLLWVEDDLATWPSEQDI